VELLLGSCNWRAVVRKLLLRSCCWEAVEKLATGELLLSLGELLLGSCCRGAAVGELLRGGRSFEGGAV